MIDRSDDSETEAVREVLIHRVTDGEGRLAADHVAVEEPLELRLRYVDEGRRIEETICVTMRTPGSDAELAAGYLYAEGVIDASSDLAGVSSGADDNVLVVEMEAGLGVDLRRLQRSVFTSSSCGVCGTPSLDALAHATCPDLPSPRPMVDPVVISTLPDTLFRAQNVFQHTGGLHAAALFDTSGRLLRLREDVGRHNAMDKLIGSCLLDGLDVSACVALVSGRTSYELVQKALVAGFPILAAVGAPSSLAISLAQAHDLTLIGFLRDNRYNVYHGEERLREAPSRNQPHPSPQP